MNVFHVFDHLTNSMQELGTKKMKKKPVKKTITPAADKCTEAQRKHLLSVIEIMWRKNVRPSMSRGEENHLRMRRRQLSALINEIDKKLEPYDQAEPNRKKKVNDRLWEEAQKAKTAVYFKSAQEALQVVEAFLAEFDPLLEAR